MKRQFHLLARFSLILLSSIMSFDAIGESTQTPTQAEIPQGVPRLVKFGGLLKDASGTLLANTVGITFAVYSEQTGGVPLWQETQNVQFSQGRYTVLLGESTSTGIPAELFASGQPRWLGIRVLMPGEEEQPRVLLASVPYALKAADADTLGGLPASAFMQTNGNNSSTIVMAPAAAAGSTKDGVRAATSSTVTTSGGTLGTIPYFSTSTDIESSAMTYSATTGVVGVKNFESTVFADQFCATPCPDAGAAVTAAIAALPTVGGVKSGVVSLAGFAAQGVVTLATTINLNSHSVSLIGPGRGALELSCTVSSGDCIRIQDLNFGSGAGTGVGGITLSGFTLTGHGTTGVNGIHAGDITPLHMQDITVFGFGGIGIWFDNELGTQSQPTYTEQLSLSDVSSANNATCVRYSNHPSNPSTGQYSTSFGYGEYRKFFIQPGSAQTGLLLDSNNGVNPPLIYHSFLGWIFEDLSATGPGTFLQLAGSISNTSGAAMVDNVYDIVEEDQAGISPKGLNLGNSSQMTGQGMFHAWLGVKPPSTASGTLGTNVAFNIIGRVQFVNGPWTPIQSNQFALSGWGSSAALSGSIIGFYPNFTFTVAAGTSASANPNVTITFPPGTWVDAVTGAVAPSPIYECKDVGGTAPISFITGEQTSTTTTSMMIQYDNNTPLTSGQTVQITCIGNAR